MTRAPTTRSQAPAPALQIIRDHRQHAAHDCPTARPRLSPCRARCARSSAGRSVHALSLSQRRR